MFSQTRLVSLTSIVALLLGVTSCNGNQASNTTTSPQADGASPAANTATNSNLSGSVKIDGSSTVLPVSEAMAEEFQRANPNVQVTVGESGTGGGFKKFCAGKLIFPTPLARLSLKKWNSARRQELNTLNSQSSTTASPLWLTPKTTLPSVSRLTS